MLIHMISIDKMLKLYQGQGHKVKGQGHICSFLKKTCFGYISWANHWTLMMSIHMISINVMLKLTKGQGHKVKSQGHKVKGQIQICKCVKML